MKGLKKNAAILKKKWSSKGKGNEHNIDYKLVCMSRPVVNDRTPIFTNLI